MFRVGSEFKLMVGICAALLGSFVAAWMTIGKLTDTQEHAFWGWALLAVCAAMFVVYVGTGLRRPYRQQRAAALASALLAQGRHLELLVHVEETRNVWPQWEGLLAEEGLASLALWRVEHARKCFHELLGLALTASSERVVMTCALVAAELAGDADAIRERADRARLAPEYFELPNAIRAVREGDLSTARELLASDAVQSSHATFRPLIDALMAWASEPEPVPFDKVRLLGETGLAQVERVWPDLADFLRRAP